VQSSELGRDLLNNKVLTETQRNFLINIITEETFRNNIVVQTTDFSKMLDEIISIFPSEAQSRVILKPQSKTILILFLNILFYLKDYFFIPRGNKHSYPS